MPRITGTKQVGDRLRTLAGKEKIELVGQALFAGGELIKAYAQTKISEGAISGANHVPSKPGEFPKYDTGQLSSGIENHQVAPLRVEVSSNAQHAVPLERGTHVMAERPYMKPSTDAKRKEVVALVEKAVSIAVRKRK
jgi:hypothetical protein